jgi:hypothetical protein
VTEADLPGRADPRAATVGPAMVQGFAHRLDRGRLDPSAFTIEGEDASDTAHYS